MDVWDRASAHRKASTYTARHRHVVRNSAGLLKSVVSNITKCKDLPIEVQRMRNMTDGDFDVTLHFINDVSYS